MRKLLRHKLEFLHAADSGQTLVLIALGLMMFLMVAALGVDVGYLHYQQEQLQKAADAGAIAAATALSYNGEWMDAGLNDVAANGFSNGVGGVTVTINNPPAAPDPFAGNSNYVQVIVTKPIPTFFMRIAGRYSVNVTSRAVANAAGNASACIWVLDPTDSGSLLLDGNVNLNASCGIRIESDSPSALTKHGNSGSITVGGVLGSIGIVGRCSGCDSNVTPTPVTGIPKFNDPLGSVPAPVNPYTCGSAPQNPPSGYVYQPSCYYGISVPANGTYTFKQ